MSDGVKTVKMIDRNKLLLVMNILSGLKGERFFAVSKGEVIEYVIRDFIAEVHLAGYSNKMHKDTRDFAKWHLIFDNKADALEALAEQIEKKSFRTSSALIEEAEKLRKVKDE